MYIHEYINISVRFCIQTGFIIWHKALAEAPDHQLLPAVYLASRCFVLEESYFSSTAVLDVLFSMMLFDIDCCLVLIVDLLLAFLIFAKEVVAFWIPTLGSSTRQERQVVGMGRVLFVDLRNHTCSRPFDKTKGGYIPKLNKLVRHLGEINRDSLQSWC